MKRFYVFIGSLDVLEMDLVGCIPPFVGTKVRKGIVLDETKYVHVRNELNGDLFTKVGPQLYFPGPYDIVIETRDVS